MSRLSEQEIASIAARLLLPRDAQIYIWHTYGKPTEPPMTFWALSKHFRCSRREINQSLKHSRPLIVAAVREQQAMPSCILTMREGLTEDELPMTFHMTGAFGHKPHTFQDVTQREAVRELRRGRRTVAA